MNLARITRHLLMTHWQLRRAYGTPTLAAIEAAIRDSECRQSGQIRFAVESALHGRALLHDLQPRQRALEVFAGLHMWDTEQRNGVLIYLLLADRAVEIVVDRGAHQRVEPAVWQQLCGRMERELEAGHFREAVLLGIQGVTEVMSAPFPGTGTPSGELPDTPVVL